jgi:hypothetical protein
MPTFQREAAVDYAVRWALERNPQYPDYSSSNGGGGDCTNFVSQVMHAGGWPMVLRGFSLAWWANADDSGRLWRVADECIVFAKGIGRLKECARHELDLADLVTMNPPDTRIYHILIITAKQQGELLYSQHSTDRLHRPLKIPETEQSSHTFRYWKAVESFPK